MFCLVRVLAINQLILYDHCSDCTDCNAKFPSIDNATKYSTLSFKSCKNFQLPLCLRYIFFVFVEGKENDYDDNLKDILKYDKRCNTWEEVGQMKEARGNHAVAVLEDVSQLCP